MTRDEDFERTDVCEKTHFVDLFDHTVDLYAAQNKPDIQFAGSAP
jgi:hypothetical protein